MTCLSLTLNRVRVLKTPSATRGTNVYTVSPVLKSINPNPPLLGAQRPRRPSLVWTPFHPGRVRTTHLFLQSHIVPFTSSIKPTRYGTCVGRATTMRNAPASENFGRELNWNSPESSRWNTRASFLLELSATTIRCESSVVVTASTNR